MENFIYIITNSILEFKILDAVDILLVTFIIYELIKLTKKTRAVQVLKGVGVFVLFATVCDLIGLTTISWLLTQFLSIAAIMLVILFQPELRDPLPNKFFIHGYHPFGIMITFCIIKIV